MHRPSVVILLGLILVTPVRSQAPAEKRASVAYVQALQTSGGGFLPAAADAASKTKLQPSLRATSSALRALKYFGGEPRDRASCVRFVQSCFDKTSGGYADQPGGKPDVFTTAVGIMAAVDLGVLGETERQAVLKYLGENVKNFEDIRIAVAGLERMGGTLPPQATAWKEQILKMRNPDGSFGQGPGLARETGSAGVALLRLGVKPAELEATLPALKAGQRPDGGFGKAFATDSDLETSYRVLRCFVMFKQKPKDPAALQGFIAKCRNADGGYGLAPGQKSTVASTYFAAILQHWLAGE